MLGLGTPSSLYHSPFPKRTEHLSFQSCLCFSGWHGAHGHTGIRNAVCHSAVLPSLLSLPPNLVQKDSIGCDIAKRQTLLAKGSPLQQQSCVFPITPALLCLAQCWQKVCTSLGSPQHPCKLHSAFLNSLFPVSTIKLCSPFVLHKCCLESPVKTCLEEEKRSICPLWIQYITHTNIPLSYKGFLLLSRSNY